MKKNVGLIDRIIRILLIVFILYGYYVGWIMGWGTVLMAGVTIILITSSLSGNCTFYTALGWSTKEKVKPS